MSEHTEIGDVDTEMNVGFNSSVANTSDGPPETDRDFDEKDEEGEEDGVDEDGSEMSSEVSAGEDLRVGFCFCG
jgi:hypothetical protein